MEISEFYEDMTSIETSFNKAGSIPIVAIVSGGLRASIANIQFTAGIILGLIGLIASVVSGNARKWDDLCDLGYQNIKHGFFNGVRGAVEVLLGCTIVGSLALFALQTSSADKFAPGMKYKMPKISPLKA